MKRPKRPRVLSAAFGLLIALGLFAAACGNDDGSAITAQATPIAGPSATASTAATASSATEQTGTQDGGHASTHQHLAMEVEYEPVPTIDIKTHLDPKSGVNVEVITTGFTLAPERASTDPVDGEGHFHIYVDGVKERRLYSHWAHLDLTKAGTYEVMVELSANDHSPLAHNGNKLEARALVTIPESGTSTQNGDDHGHHDHDHGDNHGEHGHDHSNHDHEDDHGDGDDHSHADATAMPKNADVKIGLELSDGKPVDGVQRYRVQTSDVVAVMVSGDTADEVHIHGYDIVVPFAPDEPGMWMFEADIPGTFEVETHGNGHLVMELEVR